VIFFVDAEMLFDCGHAHFELQAGDWKPMSTIGAGVRETRIRDAVGAYRVICIATFADAIQVLHAARRLGITQPRLNDLLHGKINKFSLDTLMTLATRLGLKVKIDVRSAA
jgi:predicted XRE-type DNA-binding protein